MPGLGVPPSSEPDETEQQPGVVPTSARRILVPPAGLYVKRHKVRRRVVELQTAPLLLPDVLDKHRHLVEEGVRVAHAGLETRVRSRQREMEAQEDRDREHMLQQIRLSSEEGAEFVEQFYQAHHLLAPRHIAEHKDINREPNLYQEARDVIVRDVRMKDYSAMHIGDVVLRPKTSEEKAEQSASQRYITRMSQRLQDLQECDRESCRIKKLSEEAVCLDEEAKTLQHKVDGADRVMSFEAKATARRRILELKGRSAELLSECEVANRGLQRLKQQLQHEEDEFKRNGYASQEPTSAVGLGGTTRPTVRLAATNKRSVTNKLKVKASAIAKFLGATAHTNKATASAVEEKEQAKAIVAWFIAVASREGRVERLYHGAFSAADQPPSTGWLSLSPLKDPHQVRKECRLTLRSNDLFKANQPASADKGGGLKKYTIVGSEVAEVNGTYTESGRTDGVIRYTSLAGLSLFRRHLHEIPELGITVASVHPDPSASASVTTRLRSENQEEPASLSFEQLYRVATRMRTMDTVNKAFRRQEQQAEAELKKEERFQRKLAQASKALKQVEGNASDSGLEGSVSPVVMVEEDTDVSTLQIPNTTFQSKHQDVRLRGADILVPTQQEHPPPLCGKWVHLSCPKEASVCLKRHYYVSEEERAEMIARRQSKEVGLEVLILKAIAVREDVLKQVLQEAAAVHKRSLVQADPTAGLPEDALQPLLLLLDRLRLATVRTVEAIDKWRTYIKEQREVLTMLLRLEAEKAAEQQGADADKLTTGDWIVTLTVAGAELYGPSPPFGSRFKRYQRQEKPPKRAVKIVYLGVYPNKVLAARAYDLAMQTEAARLKLPVGRMPKKQFRLRPCGRHWAVETAGCVSVPCEQCLARQLDGVAELSPIYVWNGDNYLLKMATDLTRLEDMDVLRLELGPAFSFEGNPLLLASPQVDTTSRFGTPSTEMRCLGSQVHEWQQQRAWGTKFTMAHAAQPDAAEQQNMRHEPEPAAAGAGDELHVHEVELLSLRRVKAAEAILKQELALATMLHRPLQVPAGVRVGRSKASHAEAPKMRAVVPRYRVGWKMVDKDAQYAFLGAKLVMTQTRFPVPYKDPQVWCPSEEGEWKGMAKGRAVRSMQFRVKLQRDIRKRNKYLKRVGAELAREIGKHFLEADFAKIAKLMAIGEKVGKGTAMETDLYSAKMYLLRCEGVFRIARFLQSRWRGYKGRQRAASQRALLSGSLRYKVLYDKSVAAKALDTVKMIFSSAISKAAAGIRTPIIKVFASIERQPFVVSDYMHRATVDEDKPRCASCRHANPVMGFHLATQKFQLRPPVCTCVTTRPPERLLFSLYEPLECRTRTIALSEEAMRSHLVQEHAQGTLQLSNQLLDACRLRGQEGDVAEELLGYRKGAHFLTLGHCCYTIGRYSRGGRDRWEAVREARVLAEVLAFARTMADGAQQQASKATLAIEVASEHTEASRLAHEHACMYYEESRVRFLREVEAWQAAIEGTSQALEFAKRGMKEFEDVTKEDWRQQWDPHENGNNWVQLRFKRARERSALAARRESVEGHLAMFSATMQLSTARWEEACRRKEADKATSKAMTAWQVYGQVAAAVQERERLMRQLLQAVTQCLAVRTLPMLPPRDVVMLRAPIWAKVTDGKQRQGRDYRKAWNLVCRRLMRVPAPYGYDPSRGPLEVRDIRLVEKAGTGTPVGPPPDQQDSALPPKLSPPKAPVEATEAAQPSSRASLGRASLGLGLGLGRASASARALVVQAEQAPQFVVSILHDPTTGHLLIKAYRLGAMDSKELHLSAKETKAVLSGTHARLLLPLVLPHGDFQDERKAQADRFSRICQVILSNLKLDIYGQLTIGTMTFSRKVSRLLEVLAPSLWGQDMVMRGRPSGKGVEVFRDGMLVGGRFSLLAVHESVGQLLLECYDPTLAKVYVFEAPLEMLVVRLLQPGYVDLLSAFLDSVRASHYPPELIARLVQQMELHLPGTLPTPSHESGPWSDGAPPHSLPSLRMRPFGDEGYTHTTLCTPRCLSGKVVRVTVRESVGGAVLVMVGKGDMGPPALRYKGRTLRMELDLASLRAFLVATGCSQETAEAMLWPGCRGQAFNYLLDRLVIVQHKHQPSVTGKAAEGWARTQALLTEFGEWCSRYRVPFRVDRVLPADEKTWRRRSGHEELEQDDEVVKVDTDGSESVVCHSLELRRDPNPDDARPLLCALALSFPDHSTQWQADARHVVVQLMLEDLAETSGQDTKLRIRVREQSTAELMASREAQERQTMQQEERDSWNAEDFWQIDLHQRRRQLEQAEQARSLQQRLLQVARLQHRLKNELNAHRNEAWAILRAQRLAIVRVSLPKLLRLLSYTDDSRARLDLPPLEGFSVIARGSVTDGVLRPFVRRRHRSTQTEVELSSRASEAEVTLINCGARIMRLGGPACPKCLVAVYVRPATCILEIFVYQPGTCQGGFLHLSFESLASAKEIESKGHTSSVTTVTNVSSSSSLMKSLATAFSASKAPTPRTGASGQSSKSASGDVKHPQPRKADNSWGIFQKTKPSLESAQTQHTCQARLQALAAALAQTSLNAAERRLARASLYQRGRAIVLTQLQELLRQSIRGDKVTACATAPPGHTRPGRLLVAALAIMAVRRLHLPLKQTTQGLSGARSSEAASSMSTGQDSSQRSVQVSLRLLYPATSLISLYRLRKAKTASQPPSTMAHGVSIVDADAVRTASWECDLDRLACWLAPHLQRSFQAGSAATPEGSQQAYQFLASLRATVSGLAHQGLESASSRQGESALWWALWVKVLRAHFVSCKLAPTACPVPLCAKLRQGILVHDERLSPHPPGTLEHVPLRNSQSLLGAENAQHASHTHPAYQPEDTIHRSRTTNTSEDGLALDPLVKAIERAIDLACQDLQQRPRLDVKGIETAAPVEHGEESGDVRVKLARGTGSRGNAAFVCWRRLHERRDAALRHALSYESHSAIPFLSAKSIVPVSAYEPQVGAGLLISASQRESGQASRPALEVVLSAGRIQALLALDEEAQGNVERRLTTNEDLSVHINHCQRLLPRIRVPLQPQSCDRTPQGQILSFEAVQHSAIRCLGDARVWIKASAGLTAQSLNMCAYDPGRVEEATVTLREDDARQLLQFASKSGRPPVIGRSLLRRAAHSIGLYRDERNRLLLATPEQHASHLLEYSADQMASLASIVQSRCGHLAKLVQERQRQQLWRNVSGALVYEEPNENLHMQNHEE